MEDLNNLNIVDILSSLEAGYDIIETNLHIEQEDFLNIGHLALEENTIPELDYKLSLKDYLLTLRKED